MHIHGILNAIQFLLLSPQYSTTIFLIYSNRFIIHNRNCWRRFFSFRVFCLKSHEIQFMDWEIRIGEFWFWSHRKTVFIFSRIFSIVVLLRVLVLCIRFTLHSLLKNLQNGHHNVDSVTDSKTIRVYEKGTTTNVCNLNASS